MLKPTGLICTTAFLVMAFNSSAPAQSNVASLPNNFQPATSSVSSAGAETDRVRDGLAGPVRRVRTEIAKLSNKNGKMGEQTRVLLETAAYDLRGVKTESAYFPVSGATLTGKEVYKYDEKGNISEMTLQNADGSLLSKETYTYEFDFVGNWTKMTTSVAVVEGGKLSFEPVEVTYRTISYYLDENLAKMVQPSQPAVTAPASGSASSAPVKTNAQTPVTTSVPSLNKESNAKQALPNLVLPAAASIDKSKMVAGPNSVAAQSSAVSSPAIMLETEPPAKPLPKPLLKPVSGGVLNGKAISLPKPLYPDAAKRTRASGIVTVEVILDETGKVVSARATSGNVFLRDAAVQAAQKARFSPTKLSGQPVKISGQITYNFSLDQ